MFELSFALLATMASGLYFAEANLDYFRSQDLDIAPHYWSDRMMMMENSSFGLNAHSLGCNFCGDDIFYHEPPPDDIIFIPSPPMHPNFHTDGIQKADIGLIDSKKNAAEPQCNFCNIFFNEGEQLLNQNDYHQSISNRVVALLVAFLSISAVLFIYLISTRRSNIAATLARARLFKSSQPINTHGHQIDKNSSLNETISNSGVHLSGPCFLQTNRDKNLTSPIISDHVSHKKTSIPSKYWAQPGSIIGRTIRRIPNEYEVPSSRTNSTGTSSAVYADMNNETNQRFFSPYNLHTYAEVREVLDMNEHFHTSSNSSVMLSESNYDNAANAYNHGSCVMSNGAIVTAAPNGSVQMSDFNSIRPAQSTCGQAPSTMNNHHINQQKLIHNNGQTMYEQPPQRAQIIITSNDQGVNPALLNYRERIHNVI